MSNELVARLRNLDCCAVSDALDRLGGPAAVTGLTRLTVPKRIAGRAVTVKLGPTGGGAGKRHLCTAAVESADEDTIIVISNGGRTDVAGWGGILSLALTARKGQGVIIDGAARDIDEAIQFGLPIYGRAGVAVTARGRVEEEAWGTPVDIAGVPVGTGDLVIADASGVAFVPEALAEAVIAAAEAIMSNEHEMAEKVRAGVPVSQVMGARYETMLQAGGSDD